MLGSWDAPTGSRAVAASGHKQSHSWPQAPGWALLTPSDEMSHRPPHSSPGDALYQMLHGNSPRRDGQETCGALGPDQGGLSWVAAPFYFEHQAQADRPRLRRAQGRCPLDKS